MIHSILVPLDLSSYSQQATERACAIGDVHRHQVAGMTVLDIPDTAGSDRPFRAAPRKGEGMPLAGSPEDAESFVAGALKRFSDTCEAKGVAHVEAGMQAVPAECVLKAASLYDLVVIGLRTHFHFGPQTTAGDSLKNVLDRSTTPVLAVPKQGNEPFKKVLVAFDGSPPSNRALHALVDFEPVEDLEVTVLMSDEDRDRSRRQLEQAAEFLRGHGFNKIETVATTDEIEGVIDHDYIDKVDLIVAGMYSKTVSKDFCVGSLTQRLIDYGHTALLLGP